MTDFGRVGQVRSTAVQNRGRAGLPMAAGGCSLSHREQQEQAMGVEGIGGIFFRARDPDGLSAWYRAHLNIGAGCNADHMGPVDEWAWLTKAGPVVFAPFPSDTGYFAADKAFMINLRVSGIDALIAALRGAGIAVETSAEWDAPETGRFARLHDPEGNAIELWQPPA